MVDNTKILSTFGSMLAYDQYRIEWAFICYKLNPTRRNWERLENIVLEKK